MNTEKELDIEKEKENREKRELHSWKKCKIYGLTAYKAQPDEVIIRYSREKLLSKKLSSLKFKFRNKQTKIPLFKKYGEDNAYIFLIEDYPCTSLDRVKTRIIYWNIKLMKDPIAFRAEVDNLGKIQTEIALKPEDIKTCECGLIYEKSKKKRHLISKAHLENMK